MQIKSVHMGNLWGIRDACCIHIFTSSAPFSPCRPVFHLWSSLWGSGTGGTRPTPAFWKTCRASAGSPCAQCLWKSTLRTTPKCSPPGNVCVPTDLFWLGMSPRLSNRNTKRTNKNCANCLAYFRKSSPFVIRGPFWEHDGSLGTLEISWCVPGHPEDNIGLNSLCGWDLCKMQLKTESKDLAT